MKFKVGGEVTIRSDLKLGKCGSNTVTSGMLELAGRKTKITKESGGEYRIDLSPGLYWWTPEMFEPKEEFKVGDREFKVGDRVKVMEGDAWSKKGWTGAITELRPKTCRILYDNGQSWAIMLNQLAKEAKQENPKPKIPEREYTPQDLERSREQLADIFLGGLK